MTSTRLRAALVLVAVLTSASAVQAQQQPSQDMRDAHDVLRVSTTASMLVTATLGTLLAINKPTLFGDGRCAQDRPVFGEYGCHGLSVLHGVSALVSLVLYTATTTLEIDQFGWPSMGRGTGFAVANWIDLVGMSVLPIVGLVMAVPQVLGLDLPDGSLFRRVLRTVHLAVGYTTVGTFVATTAIEL